MNSCVRMMGMSSRSRFVLTVGIFITCPDELVAIPIVKRDPQDPDNAHTMLDTADDSKQVG